MLEMLGMLFGGLFRLAPEVIKWQDRKDERAHERLMLDSQIRADELRAKHAAQLAQIEADKVLGVEELKALVEGVQAQATPTGVKWVDAVSSLMRPLITFWWVVILQTAVMAASFSIALAGGMSAAEALLQIWGAPEKAIVGSIIGYWFLDRTLRRQ